MRFIRNSLSWLCSNPILVILFFIILGIKLLLLLSSGMILGGDSHFYLSIIYYLSGLSGIKPDCQIYYMGYPLLIAGFIQLFGIAHIVMMALLIQMIIATISCLFLYKILLLYLPSEKISFILTIFYSLNFEVFNWDRYLLTDSFSLSLMIITAWFILKQISIPISLKGIRIYLPIIGVLLGMLLITRPTNIVFVLLSIIVLFGYFLFELSQKKRLILGIIAFCLLIGVTGYFYERIHIVSDLKCFFLSSMISGQVIDDRSTSDDVLRNFEWKTASKYTQIFFLFQVFMKRMIYFWTLITPRYSLAHQIFNLIWLLPIWIGGAIGIFISLFKNRTRLTIFPVSLILGYNIFHACTMIDSDFRYRIVVIPFMFIAIAIAINYKYIFFRKAIQSYRHQK